MKWIAFKECNRKLGNAPPPAQAPFFPGKFYTDGTNSVYCFRASLRERLSVLLFGRVWLTMKLGKDIAPAMTLRAQRTVFEKPRALEPMVAKSSCKHCHGTGSMGVAEGKEIPCSCLIARDEAIQKGHKIESRRNGA